MDNVVFKFIGKPDSAQRRGTANPSPVESANTNRQTPSLLIRMSQAQAQDFPNNPNAVRNDVPHPTLHERLVPATPYPMSSGMLSLSERMSFASRTDAPQKHTYPSLLNRISTVPSGPRHGPGRAPAHKHTAPAALAARISPPSTSRFPPRAQQEGPVARPRTFFLPRTQIPPEATTPVASPASESVITTFSATRRSTQNTGEQHSSSSGQAMEIDASSATPTPPPLTPSSDSLSPAHPSVPLSSPRASSSQSQLRGVSTAASPRSTSPLQPSTSLLQPPTSPQPQPISPPQQPISPPYSLSPPHPNPPILQSTITSPNPSSGIPSSTDPIPCSQTSPLPNTSTIPASGGVTLDTSQTLRNTPSLTAMLAFHMSPLWAESEAQAREWGEVAEQRAKGCKMQEQQNSGAQSLQSGRDNGRVVKKGNGAHLTNKRTREVDTSDTEERLEPMHEEPPHKKAKAAVEDQAPIQGPAFGQILVSSPISAPTPSLAGVLEPAATPMVQPLGQATPCKDKEQDDDADSTVTELSEIEALQALEVIKAIEAREQKRAEQEKEEKRRNLEQELAIVRREERVREAERAKKAKEEEMARKERETKERLRKEREEQDRLLKEREQKLRDEVQKRKRERPVQVGVSTGAASSPGPSAGPKISTVTKHSTSPPSQGVVLGSAKSTPTPEQSVVPVSNESSSASSVPPTPTPAISLPTAAMESSLGYDVLPRSRVPSVPLPTNTESNATSLAISTKQCSQPDFETLPISHCNSSVTSDIATGHVSATTLPTPAPRPLTDTVLSLCTPTAVEWESLKPESVLATSMDNTDTNTSRSDATQGMQVSLPNGKTSEEGLEKTGLLVVEDRPRTKPSRSISPPPPSVIAAGSSTPIATTATVTVTPAKTVQESKLKVKPEPEIPSRSNSQVPTSLHPSVFSIRTPTSTPTPDADVDASSLKALLGPPPLGHSAPTPPPARPLKRTLSPSLLASAPKRMRETSMSIDTEYLELTYPDGDDEMGWGGPVEGDEEERRPGRGRRARTEEERSRSPRDGGKTPPRRMSRSRSGSLSRPPPLSNRDFRRPGSPGRVSNVHGETRTNYSSINTRRYASGPLRARPRSPPMLRDVRSRSRSPSITVPRALDHWSPTPPRGVGRSSALLDREYDSYVRPSDYGGHRRGVPHRVASAVSRHVPRHTPSPPVPSTWDLPQPVRRTPVRSRAYFAEHHVLPRESSYHGSSSYDRNNSPVRGRSPPLRPGSPISPDHRREQHLISRSPPARPTTYDIPPSSTPRVPPNFLSQRSLFSRDRLLSSHYHPPEDDAPRSTPRFQPYPDLGPFRTSSSAPTSQARVPHSHPHTREPYATGPHETAQSQDLADRFLPSHRSLKNMTSSGDERTFESAPRRGRGAPRGYKSGPSRGHPGRAKLVARLSDAPVAGFSE